VCVTERHPAGSLAAANAGTADHQRYPGEDLGLPETGPGSVASQARRLGALAIDWLVWSLVVILLLRPTHLQAEGWTLALFAASDVVFTAFTGFTIGKLALRIRVVRLDGKIVGLGWAFVRTLLLLLIAPALIADGDLRAMHDRASNTVVVRT
jgi:uncharacterized RDD family membrane protein YckC